ncbi:uncharacterized protein [Drosophila kikkawai]|uniref:Uncharacterized protein n=1 Tax=Drosophila kikkawai TaxID=30033 RepID=A0A6P4JDM5_DROKI|nr:uncharacterized protein LOC108081986 [Drosophila kikkawai]
MLSFLVDMESVGACHERLVKILKDAGVYEDGMDEEEMQQMARAMQMSIIDTCPQQENELEFLGDLHSSTLIVTQAATSTVIDPCDSPVSEPIYMTVQALVHHAMDWSPQKDQELGLARKRNSADSHGPGAKRSLRLLGDRVETQVDEQQDEPPYNPDATPVSLNENEVEDSGISWEEISLSSVGSSIPSIGEMPSGHMVSTSSVAVSESSESRDESSRDQFE